MTIVSIIIAVAIVVADFLTKRFVYLNISPGETFGAFTPLIDFTYVQNTGAAFGMLSGMMSVLAIISIAFCIGMIIFWIIKKPTHKLLCTSLALIFAGALGNGIDRVAYGFVVDFIETTFIEFPVFNIADIGVTVGAALLMIYLIFFDKEDADTKKE